MAARCRVVDPLSAGAWSDTEGNSAMSSLLWKPNNSSLPGDNMRTPRGSDHGQRKVTTVSLVDINNQHSGVYTAVTARSVSGQSLQLNLFSGNFLTFLWEIMGKNRFSSIKSLFCLCKCMKHLCVIHNCSTDKGKSLLWPFPKNKDPKMT